MDHSPQAVDYVDWDWLPLAASEIQDYLARLLTEGSISAHAVQSRSKLIASFQEKVARKGYDDPRRQVTDTVAVRLIMFSVTDRDRAADLVRERFSYSESFNPGEDGERDASRRGYECTHIVITGERPGQERGWLVAGGPLARYFERFGGLEIQIRTVAAHAWAEFEHARRYKSAGYEAIGAPDRQTIDELFSAAADARRVLDETFAQIEQVLANPTAPLARDEGSPQGDLEDQESEEDASGEVDVSTLRAFLAQRFPEDAAGSDRGLEFGCELVEACGIATIRQLEWELAAIDSAEIRRLTDTTTSVTRVRRLDDELLALYGEEYIRGTEGSGSYGKRGDQLRWRYDKLRGKATVRRRAVSYQLLGADCPEALVAMQIPATRAVRELARIIADRRGREHALREGAISSAQDLPAQTRARPVRLEDGTQLWVATSLGRQASERLMASLLGDAGDLNLTVIKNGEKILSSR